MLTLNRTSQRLRALDLRAEEGCRRGQDQAHGKDEQMTAGGPVGD
jgi:hypothetical protein